jgi:GDPmannose 4,6-dehydratase
MSGTALVTGVTGQDGGYLVEQLAGRGWTVHGVVRPGEVLPEPLSALGGAVVLHEADLLDPSAMRQVLDAASPDAVFNLAGLSSVAESWDQPVLAARVNGLAVAFLLDLVWRRQQTTGNAVRFLQASSAEIFSGAEQAPQDESTEVSPRSPYGAAKAYAHHLVQVYRARGLHAVSTILYNHESPRRPPTFVTRKITQAVAAIAEGQQRSLVLGNLAARRDWGWAPEYVDAMVRALQHSSADDYVIATGRSHSVEDFVAAAFARVGIHDWRELVSVDPALHRPVDAVELVGDASRARERLGWSAEVEFRDIVGRMVDHDRMLLQTARR